MNILLLPVCKISISASFHSIRFIRSNMLVIEPHTTAAIRLPSANVFIPRSKCWKLRDNCVGRRCGGWVNGGARNRIRATAKEPSGSGPVKQNVKPQRYHPFEDISDSELLENGLASLTPAEATRTIIEVNSKATLMFSGLVNEEVHENIFWPDLPYVTDEHGNIYFQVKNDEDILQTLTSEENIVQVIVGLDTAEMISELEALGHSDINFGVDELDGEGSDYDDDEEDDDDDDDAEDEDSEDWVAILDDEEDEDEESDGSLGDWAKLETMRSSHPMYFAKRLTEVVSDDPLDFMEQPSSGLAVQGLLRPAFIEEHSVIQKNVTDPEYNDNDSSNSHDEQEGGTVKINGHRCEKEQSEDDPSWAEELEKEENLGSGFAFYKLEMIKIQLVSAHGREYFVEIEDYKRAGPDAIAHSAAKIISRLKAGGEKTTQALKSLCWRCKGIQVEECALIGVDSLGFDLRVCSGTQLQTLRFPFKKRASSEYSAERHLNDMLFPRAHKIQPRKEAKRRES